MSDLRLIKQVDITSSVSAVDVTNVFNDDFLVYKILLNDFLTTSTTADINFRFIKPDNTVDSQGQYNQAMQIQKSETAFSNLYSTSPYTYIQAITGAGNTVDKTSSGEINIFNPYLPTRTVLTNDAVYDTGYHRMITGVSVHRIYNSVTGFRLFTSNNLVAGHIKVYGYRMDF